MKNIFFAHGHSKLIYEILENLDANEKEINLIGVLTTEKKKFISKNNDIDFFFYNKLINKDYNNNISLNGDQIKYFRENGFYEFIAQTDRVSIIPKSNVDNINLYYYLTEVFLEYFKNKRITHVIFQTSPHLLIDYVILNVANYLRLKKIIFFRTYYENKTLIASDFNFQNNLFYDNKSKICKLNLNSDTKSVWNKLGTKINLDNVKLNIFKKIIKYLIFIIKRNYYTFILNQVVSTNFLNKKINIFQLNLFFLKHFLKINHLLKFYKKKSLEGYSYIKKNTEKKFVIFALHNQPEKTTQPEGLLFDNQINALRYIRKILPEDITLIVKEHPKQLNPLSGDIRQINSRTKKFYEDIIKLKNTFLIPIDMSLEEIDKNSLLNITISGTYAWESILKQIPAITFGLTWHSSCLSSPHLTFNFEKDKIIINNLLNKNKLDINEDIKKFISIINKKIFNICVSDFELEKTLHSKFELKNNFKSALKDILQ